jgi:hypothetical protein
MGMNSLKGYMRYYYHCVMPAERQNAEGETAIAREQLHTAQQWSNWDAVFFTYGVNCV